VTYTVDISGRKRETTQDRLSRAEGTAMPWQQQHPITHNTLALEPPPRPAPSPSSRVPYDAASAAPAAASSVSLVPRAYECGSPPACLPVGLLASL